VPLSELAAALGPVDEASLAGSATADATPRPSPGMTDRHYSPAARLEIFSDLAQFRSAGAAARGRGERVGAVLRTTAGAAADEVIVLPDEARGYARLFYAALHTLDAAGCAVILLESVPSDPSWAAIRDRMRRAAG
jgi:L-threonylcarbamoyladenylate synthase